MSTGEWIVIGSCIGLAVCCGLAHLFESLAETLKRATVPFALFVAVAAAVVVVSPKLYKIGKQRFGEIARPVAAAVHTPHR